MKYSGIPRNKETQQENTTENRKILLRILKRPLK